MKAVNLSHTVSPKLKLAPQLIQAIHLLQLPVSILKKYMEKSVSENPLLQPLNTEKNLESKIKDFLISSKNKLYLSNIGSNYTYEEMMPMETKGVDSQNLQDHLLHQLRMTSLTDEEIILSEEIISNMDGNGYLGVSLEEIAKNTRSTVEKAEGVLKIIQTFDPPGVGARNLQECLLIQLKNMGREGTLAYKIVDSYFKEFSRKNYSYISRKLHANIEKIREAEKEILLLNPKPGASFTRNKNTHIVPDIIVARYKNKFKITLNEQGLPKLSINSSYIKLLKDPDTPEETKQFITERLKNALWLLKAMEERRKNILRVVETILKKQKQAISRGLSLARPLTLKEIAKITGLHYSTVSRIVSYKYISTPIGTVRLRELLSRKYKRDDGRTISTKMLVSKIENVILKENKETPLTDRAISHILRKDGISISRRTVAKYRNKLKLPPSHLR